MPEKWKDAEAVDFDGTLAWYEDFEGAEVVGEPIDGMVERVHEWLAEDKDVVILTARVHPELGEQAKVSEKAIKEWCMDVFGRELEVTCMKHPRFVRIWDDRAVTVEKNTGNVLANQGIKLKIPVIKPADSIGEYLES